MRPLWPGLLRQLTDLLKRTLHFECFMPMTYDEMKFNKPQKERAGAYHVCENCGKSFYLCPQFGKDHKRGRFCSRKCQKQFHAVIKICPNCKKEFSVPRGVSSRYIYCSWKCRARLIKEYNCEHCGKTFKSNETRWKPRFCSIACYRRSRSETNLEATVRHKLYDLKIKHKQEIKIGRYSVDFLLPKYNIVVEVDGKYWHRNKERDERKNSYLQKHGFIVIRIPEIDVHNDTRLNDILSHLEFIQSNLF